MNAFLAKLSFAVSYILASLMGFDYIGLPTTDLTFNYQTNQSPAIVYNLTLKNVGPQRAKFEISSDSLWLKASREGYDPNHKPEVEANGAINIFIEIDPRQLSDGTHKAKIKIVATKPLYTDSEIDDTEFVTVIVNKNLKSTPELSKSPEMSPATSIKESPKQSILTTPVISASPANIKKTKIPSEFLSPKATPEISPTPRTFWELIIDLFR